MVRVRVKVTSGDEFWVRSTKKKWKTILLKQDISKEFCIYHLERVEGLLIASADGKSPSDLQQPVCNGTLTVIDMGDDAEIPHHFGWKQGGVNGWGLVRFTAAVG